jgi:Fe2+ transport system protein FeoA
MACHAECPLGSHCNLICCPNCGYQMVDESKSRLVDLLRQLWSQTDKPKRLRRLRRRERETIVPLTHVPAGREIEVHSLEDARPGRLARLSVFGLVPGSRIQLLQRRPAAVIRIGETELALSDEILGQIWVRLDE